VPDPASGAAAKASALGPQRDGCFALAAMQRRFFADEIPIAKWFHFVPHA